MPSLLSIFSPGQATRQAPREIPLQICFKNDKKSLSKKRPTQVFFLQIFKRTTNPKQALFSLQNLLQIHKHNRPDKYNSILTTHRLVQ